MPSTTRARHRWHAPEKGSGPAFALSLLAHVVLFIAIAFMVRWKSEPVGTVSAELWSLAACGCSAADAGASATTTSAGRATASARARAAQGRHRDRAKKGAAAAEGRAEKGRAATSAESRTKKACRPIRRRKTMRKKLEAAAAGRSEARVGSRAGAGRSRRPSSAAGGLSDAYAAQIISCIRPHIIFNVPEGSNRNNSLPSSKSSLLPTGEQARHPSC